MQLYKITQFLRKSTCWGLPKHITTFLVMFLLFISNATYAGSFTAGGITLTLDLYVAGQLVDLGSTGTNCNFTFSGVAINTLSGTTSSSVSVSVMNQLLVGIIPKNNRLKNRNTIKLVLKKKMGLTFWCISWNEINHN